MNIRVVIVVFLAALLVGCGGAKMSKASGRPVTVPIDRIAIAPGSGVMGDAIAVELFNKGFTVVDANEAASMVGRMGLKEFEVSTPRGFEVLRDAGIGAVLVAKSVDAYDGTPESASVRVTDTRTGSLIAGITWQNGWGGMRGSMADRTMRKNLSEAAQDIAEEVASRLGRE